MWHIISFSVFLLGNKDSAEPVGVHGERRGMSYFQFPFHFQSGNSFFILIYSPVTFILPEEKWKADLHIATSSPSGFKDGWIYCSPQERLINRRLWDVHQELFYLERCNFNKWYEKNCIVNATYYIRKNYIATGSICTEHLYSNSGVFFNLF